MLINFKLGVLCNLDESQAIKLAPFSWVLQTAFLKEVTPSPKHPYMQYIC